MRLKFFRRLDGKNDKYPAPVLSIVESLEYGVAELVQRLSFTIIGVIMIFWAWQLISQEIQTYPDVNWFYVLVGVVTLLLGIRNALSLFKDVTWGQAFLTLLFVAVNVYLIWFA